MLNSIKSYFETLFSESDEDPSKQEKTIELATTVLMIELSLADNHIDEKERHVIYELLAKTFALGQEEIDNLIKTAKHEVDHTVSLYEFTRLLNDKLSMKERIKVIENLWRIAYADSTLDKYEEYYIRKITDLLYVAHSEYIKAKLRAAE